MGTRHLLSIYILNTYIGSLSLSLSLLSFFFQTTHSLKRQQEKGKSGNSMCNKLPSRHVHNYFFDFFNGNSSLLLFFFLSFLKRLVRHLFSSFLVDVFHQMGGGGGRGTPRASTAKNWPLSVFCVKTGAGLRPFTDQDEEEKKGKKPFVDEKRMPSVA